ncbi:MAG: phosphodiesterase [Alphaproteobacteria bacterium]|nr:phosphodiesterase [Alphaproteobacteria bacterium]
MIVIQLTDLHCVPYGRVAMGRCETNTLSERALRAVARFRPRADALLITGDLSDNGLPGAYALLADMLRRTLDIPVYVIPGNHDRRDNFRAGLAHLPGVTDHPTFVQYTIEHLPVRIVMLDTVIPGSPAGELCAERMAWLAARLAEQPDRPTMLAMHHPSFDCGINDAIGLRNAAEFNALVARHPQVRRIICGHHHRPVTAPIAQAIASICPGIAHQVELDLATPGLVGLWNLEPAAFQVHIWKHQPGGAPVIVSHTGYVDDYGGPFPFIGDPDAPH